MTPADPCVVNPIYTNSSWQKRRRSSVHDRMQISGSINTPTGEYDNTSSAKNSASTGKVMQSTFEMDKSKIKKRGTAIRGQIERAEDKRIRNLSAANMKWYLRFIDLGFGPKEARTMAEERKNSIKGANIDHLHPKRKDRITFNAKKESFKGRKANDNKKEVKETNLAMVKKSSSVQPKPQENLVKIALVPKNFPEELLTNDDVVKLEDAIMEQVAVGWPSKIQFAGIHFSSGIVLVNCENKKTAEWLKQTASKLKLGDRNLLAFSEEDVPKYHMVSFYLPRSAGQDQCKSLALISAQNDGLDTALWKILGCCEEGADQLLTTAVDQRSYETIMKESFIIRYRFGKVPVYKNKSATSVLNLSESGFLQHKDWKSNMTSILPSTPCSYHKD